MEQKEKPVHEVKRERGIRVVIWENQSSDGSVWFNVEPKRMFKADDKWKTSQSFRREDLPSLAMAIETAYRWIWRESEKRETAQTAQMNTGGRQHSRRA